MRTLLFLTVLVVLSLVPAFAQRQEKGKAKLTDMAIKTEKHLYHAPMEGKLYLHVFYPPGWKGSDKRPILVFFFGGGWKNGSYQQFVPQAEYFASRGLVTACADYRIANTHKTTPDCAVEDAKAAIRWVRINAGKLGIDPTKVIGAGGSAGGHLAAAAALLPGFDGTGDGSTISCKPDALVLFNPALNLVGFAKIRDAAGEDITRDFSPTLFLKKGAPPTVMFFGTADKMLPQGEEYLKKAKELEVPVELYTAAEQPHGFFNRSPWLEVTTQKADEFLTKLGYLTGPATVKVPAKAEGLKQAKAAK